MEGTRRKGLLRLHAQLAAKPTTAVSGSSAPRAPSGRLNLAVFCFTALIFLAASIHLITQLGITGDEPAYLLQGYVILHFQTLNMTYAVHDPRIYLQFFNHSPTDRVYDFRGSGVELIAYLPGYPLIASLLYLLGGRLLIVVVQSLAGALTALLVFQQSLRFWQSHAVGVFATVAYISALPALLFAGQVFPSMLATLAAMVAFVLVTSALPSARGRRLLLIAASVGLIVALLPWLHVRYAPLAVCITGAALLQLVPSARERRGLRTASLPAGENGQSPATAPDSAPTRHWSWLAAVAVSSLLVLSFALIVLYSLHYFGTWYPQYRVQPSTSFIVPDLGHMLQIYQEILFAANSGLIPWVPLMLLVPAGLLALARHNLRIAALTLLWILGLLSAFLASAVAVHVNQAYALPARFTVECQPYFVLSVASLFALGWPRVRTLLAGSTVKLTGRDIALRFLTWQTAVTLICVLLLVADAWFTLVAQFDLSSLYPSREGLRLLAVYPHLLPGWWFSHFVFQQP